MSASAAASRYRSALATHYEVIEQCTAFDPVHCARRLRSKHHMSSSIVIEIERAEAAKGRIEASSRLVSHLSELSDAGVYYFVDHYLTGSGLVKISSTLRHCPGPDICSLDAAECHIDTSLQENGKKQLTKYTVGCSICFLTSVVTIQFSEVFSAVLLCVMFYFLDHRCLTWVLTVFFHCLELTLPASTEVASHPGHAEQQQLAVVQGVVLKEDITTDGIFSENGTIDGLAVEAELLPVEAVDRQVAVASQGTKSTTTSGDNPSGE